MTQRFPTTPPRLPVCPPARLPVLLLAMVLTGCDLLAPNSSPTAVISQPAAGAVLDAAEPAVFEGSGSDPEDGDLSGDALAWTSSVDGALGTGPVVSRTGLTLGSHTVTLTVTDSDGATDSTSVRVTVNARPTVEIVGPADGARVNQGGDVAFEGRGSDPEDGRLTGASLVWSSSVDGTVGTGETLTRPVLTPGTHTITLTGRDSNGVTAEASIGVTVNAAPTVTIVSPSDSAVYGDGEAIRFEGVAADAEEGTLTGASLAWLSDVDGPLGTGGILQRSGLSAGVHAITLVATDAGGAVGSAGVEIVAGLVPVALGEPAVGLRAAEGAAPLFMVEVPETGDAVRLRFLLTGGNGDADLYVRRGEWPGTGSGQYDCRSWDWGNEETCTFEAPEAGTWYVLLDAFSGFAGAVLLVELETATDGCTLDSPDFDGDRLPDCAETGTGVYVSELDTGTRPTNRDTDGDGLGDGDEVLGTLAGLDLPALGVSPLRKDILMEYDWVEDATDCDRHSHRPTPAQVARVTAMFEDAPVANPDGSLGIHVVHDFGQGGPHTGGNRIDDEDGVIAGGVQGGDYAAYKAANFALSREGYFHYVLMLHRYNTDSRSSGQAEIGFDDMIVSLQCFVDIDRAVANTIAHELGHNLGLLHGGSASLPNYKPNYNSVMNYKYQFSGVDDDCTPPGNGVLDYSHGTRPDLDEADLDESAGVCGAGNGAWDWNGDGDTEDVGIQFDINVDSSGDGDGRFDRLTDYDDWANLVLNGINRDGDGVALDRTVEVITCRDTPDLSGRREEIR